MVGSEWAMVWDAAVAPPASMIPGQDVFSPHADMETVDAAEDEHSETTFPWEDAVLQALVEVLPE